jgi:cysteinyl-tRNA synthetase
MIFGFGKKSAKPAGKLRLASPVFLTNTLSGEKEEFIPPEMRPVRMYSCGPTVYGESHIGNLRAYILSDLVKRMLSYNNLEVKQVINITDVGHLSSNADDGGDKMSLGLKREGMALTLENMRALGERYTKLLQQDLEKLSVDVKNIEFPRASDYIHAQIAMIQTLEEKGYAYVLKDGVYFDTALFPKYGELGNIDVEKLKEGARVGVNKNKHNPSDFALWKINKKIGWESPWGKGFPGWHIECSAMIRNILGEQIEIHTGGIDLANVHHNNEIAQSEATFGKSPFSQVWLHNAFLNIEDEKIAKSVGNIVLLSDLVEKGFHPLAFRYWLLGGHYRTPMNFTWEALESAQTALLRLHNIWRTLNNVQEGSVDKTWQKQFHKKINDDLDTAGALALLWDMTRDKTLEPSSFLATLLDFDMVLGIGLANPDKDIIKMLEKDFGSGLSIDDLPENIQKLIAERDSARRKKDWDEADRIRERIETEGFTLEDKGDDTTVRSKKQ